MLRKELIRLDVEAKTAEEALRIMAGLFVESGVAKPSYPDAIVAREAQYPTALPALSLIHILEPEFGPLYVTPPDIDETVKQLSFTISEGIHRAVF